jgi:uncharacterized protein YjbI with pentapeptide repeats
VNGGGLVVGAGGQEISSGGLRVEGGESPDHHSNTLWTEDCTSSVPSSPWPSTQNVYTRIPSAPHPSDPAHNPHTRNLAPTSDPSWPWRWHVTGIEILSGGLTLGDEGLKLSDGGLDARTSAAGAAPLTARALSPVFAASVLELHAGVAPSAEFKFLQCVANGSHPCAIRGDGTITTQGGLSVGGPTRLEDVLLGSRATLTKDSILAGEAINITARSSFVEITDDGLVAGNVLTLGTEGVEPGQILIVRNGDAQATSGVIIAPGQTLLFLYQGGEGWVDLSVREATAHRLQHVTELTAGANLDIGDFSFAARSFLVTGQTPGRVPVFGPRGLLTGSSDLTFQNGELTIAKLRVEELASDLDVKGNVVKNTIIDNAVMRNVVLEDAVTADLDMKGHVLRNAVIENAAISGISSVVSGIASLRTRNLEVEDSVEGGVAVVGSNGRLIFPDKLEFSSSDSSLSVPRLRTTILELEGSVGGGVAVVGPKGTLTFPEELQYSATNATLSAPRLRARTLDLDESIEGGMAVVGPNGRLIFPEKLAYSPVDSSLSVPRLRTGVLEVEGCVGGGMAVVGPNGRLIFPDKLEYSTADSSLSAPLLRTRALELEDSVEGGVAVVGPKGRLTFPAKLGFSPADSSLSVPYLRTSTLEVEGSVSGGMAVVGPKGRLIFPDKLEYSSAVSSLRVPHLRTSTLEVEGSVGGGVAVVGANGRLTFPEKLAFSPADSSLSVPRLRTSILELADTAAGGVAVVGADGRLTFPDKLGYSSADSSLSAPRLRTRALELQDGVEGGVAVVGPSGELIFPKKLEYSSADSSLSVPRLRAGALSVDTAEAETLTVTDLTATAMTASMITVSKIKGDVNCSDAALLQPKVRGGRIENADYVSGAIIQSPALAGQKGRLVEAGAGGELVVSEVMYDMDSQTLSVGRLAVEEIVGLDKLLRASDLLADQTLHNVTISGGRLEGISVILVDSIDIKGAATIDGETFITGSLTVSGTVMGSGPYVDTSDGRFKEDIRRIQQPLHTLGRLEGVRGSRTLVLISSVILMAHPLTLLHTFNLVSGPHGSLLALVSQVSYRFQEQWKLRRRLEEGEQIGFIAQEVRMARA